VLFSVSVIIRKNSQLSKYIYIHFSTVLLSLNVERWQNLCENFYFDLFKLSFSLDRKDGIKFIRLMLVSLGQAYTHV
jgi:hypothetical protein